jgi:hypothetical protein
VKINKLRSPSRALVIDHGLRFLAQKYHAWAEARPAGHGVAPVEDLPEWLEEDAAREVDTALDEDAPEEEVEANLSRLAAVRRALDRSRGPPC